MTTAPALPVDDPEGQEIATLRRTVEVGGRVRDPLQHPGAGPS